MQKVIRYILLIVSLLLVVAIHAQENPAIPPIAYILDNSLNVYSSETGSSQLVADNSGEPYVFFYRAVWSPDGQWLAYLKSNSGDMPSATLYVDNLQGQLIAVISTDFATPFFPSWLADGRLLYATYTGERHEFTAVLNAYAIAPEENAEPELLGTFEVAEGCGGGTGNAAESDYFIETSLGGYREVFTLTPFGLVHDGQCVGAEVTLTNFETGESTRLAGGGLTKAVVSPDGTQVVGLKEGQLILVNLADMSFSSIATSTTPDQYVWANATTLIYSSRLDTGDKLAAYSAEDIATINTAMGYEVEAMPDYEVNLTSLDLSTGTESPLYSADAFAIGRMAVRGNTLIFSQVENVDRWLQGMLDGTVTLDNNFMASEDLVYTQVYALDLSTLESTLLLEDAQQMVVAPQ